MLWEFAVPIRFKKTTQKPASYRVNKAYKELVRIEGALIDTILINFFNITTVITLFIIGFKGRAIIKGFTRVVINTTYNRVTIIVEGLDVSGVVSLIASLPYALLIRGLKGEVIITFYNRSKGYYSSLVIILIKGAFIAYFLITIKGFLKAFSSLSFLLRFYTGSYIARLSFLLYSLISSVALSRSLILY